MKKALFALVSILVLTLVVSCTNKEVPSEDTLSRIDAKSATEDHNLPVGEFAEACKSIESELKKFCQGKPLDCPLSSEEEVDTGLKLAEKIPSRSAETAKKFRESLDKDNMPKEIAMSIIQGDCLIMNRYNIWRSLLNASQKLTTAKSKNIPNKMDEAFNRKIIRDEAPQIYLLSMLTTLNLARQAADQGVLKISDQKKADLNKIRDEAMEAKKRIMGFFSDPKVAKDIEPESPNFNPALLQSLLKKEFTEVQKIDEEFSRWKKGLN